MEDPAITCLRILPYTEALTTLLADFCKKYGIDKPAIALSTQPTGIFEYQKRFDECAYMIDKAIVANPDAVKDFAPLRAALLDVRGVDATGEELTHTRDRLWFYVHSGKDEIFAQRIYANSGGVYNRGVYDGEYHCFREGKHLFSCMTVCGQKQPGEIAKLSYPSPDTKPLDMVEQAIMSSDAKMPQSSNEPPDMAEQAIMIKLVEECLNDPIFRKELKGIVVSSFARRDE